MNGLDNNLFDCNFEYKKIVLGEIGKVCMCKRIMKNQTSSSGDIPFYKIGTFGRKADAFISRDLFNEYKRKYSYPKKGDILISCSGTIGRTVVFDGEDSYFQDSNIVWIDNDETIVLNSYLKYVYQLNPFHISTGGTISRLYNEGIEKAIIYVPPIKVQREIVKVLDEFSKAINELKAQLSEEFVARKKQYDYYRDSLFKLECERKKLSDVCLSIRDGMHNLPQTSGDGIYPILSAQNINEGVISYDAKRYVDEDIFRMENKRTNVQIGDVFLTIVATIGRTAVVKDNNKVLLQRSVCVLKPRQELNPFFLKYWLDTTEMQTLMVEKAHGSAQIGLYLNQVADIVIPVPPIETQNKIANDIRNFEMAQKEILQKLNDEICFRESQYAYYRGKLLLPEELKA